MKDFLEILLCMFATYGFYRFIHGIKALCARRVRIVLALRADSDTKTKAFERVFGRVASQALNTDNAECEPVVLCESSDTAEKLRECGYSVYIKAD